VAAARTVPELAVVFHGGGMLSGPNRRKITSEWRSYVMPHDRRIAELTGQPFGGAYFDGLLRDQTAVMDSEPPIAAVLAAQAVAGRGLDMIHALQQAHYEQGRRIADTAVLQDIARELGLPGEAFDADLTRLSGAATREHIEASRRMLDRVGGRGFPTFALEDAHGGLALVDAGAWLGRPVEWAQELRRLVTGSNGFPRPGHPN
jgi:putative protein-disulfide isomerase